MHLDEEWGDLPKILKWFGDHDKAVRTLAAEKVRVIGIAAIPALLVVLHSAKNEAASATAAEVLRQISDARVTVDLLEEMLKSGNSYTMRTATIISTLKHLGSNERLCRKKRNGWIESATRRKNSRDEYDKTAADPLQMATFPG